MVILPEINRLENWTSPALSVDGDDLFSNTQRLQRKKEVQLKLHARSVAPGSTELARARS
jgi:hypothetical protein